MDLSYGSQYDAFRLETRRFIEANAHLAPRGVAPDIGKRRAWQQLLIDNGYVARAIPKTYGGYGGEPDILRSRIIAEEFARAQISPGLGGQGIAYLVPAMLELGSEEQKRRFIAAHAARRDHLVRGLLRAERRQRPGQPQHERRAGRRCTGSSTARRFGPAPPQIADWMFCLVRSDPLAPKHQGLSFLLFSMKTPGIRVRPLETMTATRTSMKCSSPTCACRKDQIVGQRGDGWRVANAVLLHERDDLGRSRCHAGAAARPDRADEERNGGRAAHHRQPGVPRPTDENSRPGHGHALQRSAIAERRLNQKDAALAAMIVKLQGTELRHELEGLAIDALGELGILYRDGPHLRDGGSWQFMYMLYLGLIIGGGTSQIQKNIISERGLGMPRAESSKHDGRSGMEFGLSKEQLLLQESVGRYLDRHAPLERVQRFVRRATRPRPTTSGTGLCDLGLPGMLIGEEHGGIGLSLLDAALVAETLGSRVAPAPFVATAVLVPLAIAAGRHRRTAELAGCRRWPRAASSPAPRLAEAVSPRQGGCGRSDGARSSAGVLCSCSTSRPTCTWSRTNERALYLVEADAAGLARQQLATIDETRRVGRVDVRQRRGGAAARQRDPEVCARADRRRTDHAGGRHARRGADDARLEPWTIRSSACSSAGRSARFRR